MILAIEPNHRQAAQLAAVLRGRPRTELVLADSAVRALDALGDRIPDVLLTSPLLSARDEAVLAARLRELGQAAAHVQALTIPILAQAPQASRRRGMLSVLRGRRDRPAPPDGCKPDAFVDQVDEYLERTSVERQAPVQLDPIAPPEPELAQPLEAPVVQPEARIDEALVVDQGDPDALEAQPLPLPDDDIAPPVEIAIGALVDVGIEPQAVIGVESPDVATALVPPAEPLAAPAEPEFLPEGAEFLPEGNVLEYGLTTPADDEAEWIDIPLAELCEPTHVLAPVRDDIPADSDVWVLPPISDLEPLRVEAVGPEERMQPVQEVQRVQEVQEVTVQVVQDVPVQEPPLGPPVQDAPRRTAPPRPKKRKPVQDEWGFFDPDQCGFAALLDKLDEITAADDGAADRREGTNVRLIAY